MKPLIPFNSKLLKPCKKLITIFKFKLKKPIFIRALRDRPTITRSPHSQLKKPTKRRSPTSVLRSIFRRLKPSNNMDKPANVETERDRRLLFSSPFTSSSYIKVGLGDFRRKESSDVVEDACRSFENYLVDMIVEEGKVSDLMDVEELLFCWKNLSCPVYVDLVSRFYGELCTDLFSGDGSDVDTR